MHLGQDAFGVDNLQPVVLDVELTIGAEKPLKFAQTLITGMKRESGFL